MAHSTIQRVLGLLLTIFSLSMLPPIVFALIYQDGHALVFIKSFVLVAAVGLALWFPARQAKADLRLRDGFLIVASFWIVLGVFGSAPLIFADRPDIGFTDAVFESIGRGPLLDRGDSLALYRCCQEAVGNALRKRAQLRSGCSTLFNF